MSESHHIIRPARPTWDSRINAALASRDRQALRRLAAETARAIESATGPAWMDARRAHARVQAARRYLAGWRRHG
jgi:hypothetical protein